MLWLSGGFFRVGLKIYQESFGFKHFSLLSTLFGCRGKWRKVIWVEIRSFIFYTPQLLLYDGREIKKKKQKTLICIVIAMILKKIKKK